MTDDPSSPFDSICELATDTGLLGAALGQLPRELLLEADRWPEPWEFLLSVKFLLPYEGFRQLFRAAQSQRAALSRLAEIARGAASIERSWTQTMIEATKAGDLPAAIHAQNKVLASNWKYDPGLLLNAAKNVSPEMEAEVQLSFATFDQKARRKFGRRKAEQKNRPAVFKLENVTHKIAWLLTWNWLRKPGYCFFSDNALLNVCSQFLNLQLPFETVRKTRQALGLKKAPTFIYKGRRNQNGILEFLNRQDEVVIL
jgi:hypothetical protein